MDPITGLIIGAAAIAGSLISSNSAREANKQNVQMQKETNETSIELANSAHQREVADLQAAGLNPVLSAGGTGAATPTLGTAEVQSTMPNMADTLINSANAMTNAMNAKSNQTVSNATAEQETSQAELNRVNAEMQPEIARAKIAADFAQAGSAKAAADYTSTMKQYDMALKDAQTEELQANKKRTENLTKGEQSREWVKAITGGILNVAGAAHSGRMAATNMTPIRNNFYNYSY